MPKHLQNPSFQAGKSAPWLKCAFTFLLLLGLSPASTLTAPAKPPDAAKVLAGRRLVMEGAEFAGIAFQGPDTLLVYAEMTRDAVVAEARVRWISPTLFYATEKGRAAAGCPPRTWIYSVEQLGRDAVRLREYWTGWPDASDAVCTYRLLPAEDPAPKGEKP